MNNKATKQSRRSGAQSRAASKNSSNEQDVPIVVSEQRAWFTPATLAAYLHVSDRMIRKWVAQGRLASCKIDGCRRFDPDDVDSFVAQFREPGRRGR